MKDNRDTIKSEFRYYLANVARSARRTSEGINLGRTAVDSFMSFIEPERLFDYAPEKWSHIKSMYDITSPDEVKQIAESLLNDETFLKNDASKNQGWRSGAISHYLCFINARAFFRQQQDGQVAPTNTHNNQHQIIFYGAPGTGKSHEIKEQTTGHKVIRTTFHPDSDYSTFVGCYKPTKESTSTLSLHKLHAIYPDFKSKASDRPLHRFITKYHDSFRLLTAKEAELVFDKFETPSIVSAETPKIMSAIEEIPSTQTITYAFVKQAFLKAYLLAWKNYAEGGIVTSVPDATSTGEGNDSERELINEAIQNNKPNLFDNPNLDNNPNQEGNPNTDDDNTNPNNRDNDNTIITRQTETYSYKPVFLVIEEINRGNCAQIFGDLFQLLDRGDNGFSEYPIEPDTDIQKAIAAAFKNEDEYKLDHDIAVDGAVKDYTSNYGATLSKDIQEGRVMLLPPTLYIWATMNTSDQSLFPIDSAFKRRWDWKYIKIAEGKQEGTHLPLKWQILVEDEDQNRVRLYDWWKFLQLINSRIYSVTQSADKQMGYFFAKAKDHFNGEKVGRIIRDSVFETQSGQISKDYITAETFVNKVLFYLWTDVMKDNEYEEITNLMEQKDGNRLTFPDFFGESGMEINHAAVRSFLDNVMKEEDEWCEIAERTSNKGEVSADDNASDEEMDDGLTEVDLKENGKKVNFTKVTFGDGTVIDEGDRFATYVAALKKFGLEKSAEIGENSKLHRHNLPLICKAVKQTPPPPYSYEEVEGIYIMKGTNSMHRMLIKIGKELNVPFWLD